jgi:hypothetical protein
MSSLFLFFSFFCPRTTLLICWVLGMMPANNTPFIADVLGAFFAPRLLIAWWLYEAHANPFLVAIFAIFGVLELLGGSSVKVRRSSSTRR